MSAAPVVVWDPTLRDSRHPGAGAARDQAAWLSYLELGGTAPRTLADYQWATDFLLGRFPAKSLAELNDGDIAFVLKKFPPASRRIRRAAFQSFFKWARQTRRIESNPMDLIPEMRVARRQPVNVFPEADAAALCSLPSPDGPLMAILFGTGIRKAEARALTLRRFDLARCRLNVIEGAKGSRTRVVPLELDVLQAVEELATLEGLNPGDYLWYHNPGGGKTQRNRQIGEGTFARWWTRCIDVADVTYRKPHTTRHTYATRWHNRGLGIEDIQLLLGHASITTTRDVYVHTTVDDVAHRIAVLLERES